MAAAQGQWEGADLHPTHSGFGMSWVREIPFSGSGRPEAKARYLASRRLYTTPGLRVLRGQDTVPFRAFGYLTHEALGRGGGPMRPWEAKGTTQFQY